MLDANYIHWKGAPLKQQILNIITSLDVHYKNSIVTVVTWTRVKFLSEGTKHHRYNITDK